MKQSIFEATCKAAIAEIERRKTSKSDTKKRMRKAYKSWKDVAIRIMATKKDCNTGTSRVFHNCHWMRGDAFRCACTNHMNIVVFIAAAEVAGRITVPAHGGVIAVLLCGTDGCGNMKLVNNRKSVERMLALSDCTLGKPATFDDYPGFFEDGLSEDISKSSGIPVSPDFESCLIDITQEFHDFTASKIAGYPILANPISCESCDSGNIAAVLHLNPVHLGITVRQDWHFGVYACQDCGQVFSCVQAN